MPQKLRLGLSALFGVALIASLFMRKKRKEKTRPEANNNPFALIQDKPARWAGLSPGSTGFLKFESPVYGVRAGYINLINGYILSGYNTIGKIIPRYAPAAAGNNPKAYIDIVVNRTGYPSFKPLDLQGVYKLGKAIEYVEAGKNWVDLEDWEAGWLKALTYVGGARSLSEKINYQFSAPDLDSGKTLKEKVKKAISTAGGIGL